MIIGEFINKVGFELNKSDVSRVNDTISKIKSTAAKTLGAIGIGFSLTQINALAEEFGDINDKLNYAIEYSEDMKEVQQGILESANDCRTSYGNMVNTIVSLKQANEDVFPIEEATTFVEYLNKLGKAAGYDDGQINQMQNSIQKVVATGTMGAADITRIAQQTPALIEKICDGLGVTREELIAMADAGEVTGETIKESILGATDSIDAAFDQLDYSVSDAILHIRNRWGFFIDDLNSTTGIGQAVAKGMVSGFNSLMGVLQKVRNGFVWLTEKLGGAENVLKLFAIVAGSLLLAFKFDAIAKGVARIIAFFKDGGTKALWMAAKIILIALAIDDIINFLKGNESVIGEILKGFGLDVDDVREKIIAFKDKVVELFKKFRDSGALAALLKIIAVITILVKVGTMISKVVAAFKGLTTGAGLLGKAFSLLSSGPVGWIIAGIAALIAIGVLLYKNWDKVKEFGSKAWEGLKNAVSDAWEAIKGWFENIREKVAGWFSGIGEAVSDAVGDVANWAKEAWTTIKEKFETVKDKVSGWFTGLGSAVSDAVGSVWQWAQDAWDKIHEFFSGIKEKIVGWFTGAGDDGSDAAGDASTWASEAYDKISGFFSGIVGTVSGWFTGIGSAVSDAVGDVASWASEAWTTISDKLSNAKETVSGWFSGMGEKVKEAAGDISTWATEKWQVISDKLSGAKETVSGWFSGIGSKVSEAVGDVSSWASTAWTDIKNAFGGGEEGGGVKQWFTDTFSGIGQTVSDAIGDVAGWASDTWETVKQKASDVGGWFAGLFGWGSDDDTAATDMEGKATAAGEAEKAALIAAFEGSDTDIAAIFESMVTLSDASFELLSKSAEASFKAVDTSVSTNLDTAKSNASSAFSSIASTASTKMSNAVQQVQKGVTDMKNAMNFTWSLPHLKLPHISVSGAFSIEPPSAPQFSVSWYKRGGILDGAQIFGMSGKNLLGGGEAGKEAVLPLSELWSNMKTLMQDVIGSGILTLAKAAAPSPATAASGVVNNRNSSVSQNVNINNTFNGDRAIQKKASKAMDKSAKDITAQLARGLAFTG